MRPCHLRTRWCHPGVEMQHPRRTSAQKLSQGRHAGGQLRHRLGTRHCFFVCICVGLQQCHGFSQMFGTEGG